MAPLSVAVERHHKLFFCLSRSKEKKGDRVRDESLPGVRDESSPGAMDYSALSPLQPPLSILITVVRKLENQPSSVQA